MLKWVIAFLTPPTFEDEEKIRVARLLYVVSKIGLAGAAILVFIFAFITRDFGIRPIATSIAIPMLLFEMVLAKKGYTNFAAYFVVMMTWIAGNYIVLNTGGVRTVGFGINLVVVLEAGMLISLRSGLVVAAVSSLAGLGMAIAQAQGWVAPTPIEINVFSAWGTQSLFLSLMAGLLYMSVNQIRRSLTRTQNQLEHLNALHNIDNAIKSTNDLAMTLRIFVDESITQLKVDAAAVHLFNHQTLTLEYAASRGFQSPALQHTGLGWGEGYAGRVMAERKTLHIPDLTKTESQLAKALSLAGENFITYIGSPLITKNQVVGVLEIFHCSLLAPNPEWFDFLDILTGQAAIAIENAQLLGNLQRSNLDLALAYDATIEGMARALDLRDKETEGHSQRVLTMTINLARQMDVPETESIHLRRGALLHDIGKLGVPDNILLKPKKLTPKEWDIMHKHTTYAYDMLFPIQYLRPALEIPYSHHEKWDGTGYPRGLCGDQIPLAARIFAIVDVYDALTSDRPYRKAWSQEQALEYIRSMSGKHFDPKVVECFLHMMSEKI
jgi:HD-GYP domain-containing protein (c-di-GMP phosphodiesterase class II)